MNKKIVLLGLLTAIVLPTLAGCGKLSNVSATTIEPSALQATPTITPTEHKPITPFPTATVSAVERDFSKYDLTGDLKTYMDDTFAFSVSYPKDLAITSQSDKEMGEIKFKIGNDKDKDNIFMVYATPGQISVGTDSDVTTAEKFTTKAGATGVLFYVDYQSRREMRLAFNNNPSLSATINMSIDDFKKNEALIYGILRTIR